MADDNKKDPKKGGEFRVPPRTWILWIVILGAIPLLLLFKERPETGKDQLNEHEFMDLLHANAIEKGIIWVDPQWPTSREITGTYKVKSESGTAAVKKFAVLVDLDDALNQELRESGKFERRKPNTLLQGMLFSVLPILLVALLI